MARRMALCSEILLCRRAREGDSRGERLILSYGLARQSALRCASACARTILTEERNYDTILSERSAFVRTEECTLDPAVDGRFSGIGFRSPMKGALDFGSKESKIFFAIHAIRLP